MPFTWSSFGATKPHAPTHINGGSDELDSPLNPAALSLPSVLAQDIVDAVNALESGLSVASAQDVIDSMGSYWDHYTGMLNAYLIGDDVLHSHDVEIYTTSNSYVKLKTITLTTLSPSPSTIRVSFDLKSHTSTSVQGRIYKNGGAVGTERLNSSTSYVTFSEDLSFAQGDTIELWAYVHTNPGVQRVYVRNLRVMGSDGAKSLALAISEDSIGVADAFAASNS